MAKAGDENEPARAPFRNADKRAETRVRFDPDVITVGCCVVVNKTSNTKGSRSPK